MTEITPKLTKREYHELDFTPAHGKLPVLPLDATTAARLARRGLVLPTKQTFINTPYYVRTRKGDDYLLRYGHQAGKR